MRQGNTQTRLNSLQMRSNNAPSSAWMRVFGQNQPSDEESVEMREDTFSGFDPI